MARFGLRNWVGITYIVLFVALLVYGLVHRGLFFEPSQSIAMTAAVIVGLVGLVLLTVLKTFKVPGWLIVMYTYAAYAWLTTLWAADAERAVGGALVLTAAAVMVSFVPLLSDKWRQALLVLTSVTPALLYLFAMGTVFGWYNYVDAVQGGMMDSVFQYHNTFGSFALAGALIALVLSARTKWYIGKSLLYLLACLDFVGVVASYSRWVWILTALMVLAYFVMGSVVRKRLEFTLSGVLIVALSLVAGAFTIKSMHKSSVADFLISTLIAVVAAMVIPYIAQRILAIQTKRVRVIWGLSILIVPVVLLLGIGLIEAKHFTSIIQRIHSIQFGNASLQGRLWFYGAAIHMWEHNPVFGSGAGSWTAKYMAFQQFPYTSNLTHSVFFTQLTNFGLIGTLLWIAVLGVAFANGMRHIVKSNSEALVSLAALLGAISLLVHSLMDFDMDFPTVLLIFFALMALTTQVDANPEGATEPAPSLYGVKVPMLLMSAMAVMFGIGLSISESALQASQSARNTTTKISLLKRAEHFAPYVATPHAYLSTIYYDDYVTKHATTDLNNAWREAQYAAKRGTWSPVIQQQEAEIAYGLGYNPQAYQWSQRAASDAPFNITYSTNFAGMALWMGVEEAPHNLQAAQSVFKAVVQTYDQAVLNEARIKRIPSDVTPQWLPNIQAYQIGAPFQTYVATAEYGLGQYQTSINDLHNLSKVGQNYDTAGLYELVALLDAARLGQGSVGNIPNQMQYRDTTLTAEYIALVKVAPLNPTSAQ